MGQSMESGVMNAYTITCPSIPMPQVEYIVGVCKTEDPRGLNHDGTTHVRGMASRMGSLVASNGQVGGRGHSRHHASCGAVDFEDLVDQEGTRTIEAVGNELWLERHAGRAWLKARCLGKNDGMR